MDRRKALRLVEPQCSPVCAFLQDLAPVSDRVSIRVRMCSCECAQVTDGESWRVPIVPDADNDGVGEFALQADLALPVIARVDVDAQRALCDFTDANADSRIRGHWNPVSCCWKDRKSVV